MRIMWRPKPIDRIFQSKNRLKLKIGNDDCFSRRVLRLLPATPTRACLSRQIQCASFSAGNHGTINEASRVHESSLAKYFGVETPTQHKQQSTASVVKGDSALGKYFETSNRITEPPSQDSVSAPTRRCEHIESLSRKLLSYTCIEEAMGQHDDQISILQDVVLVADYHAQRRSRPIAKAEQHPPNRQTLLSRQLGVIANTLVLPKEEMEISAEHIDFIIRAIYLTLRAYATDASRLGSDLSVKDGTKAQDLLHKLMSIRVVHAGDAPDSILTASRQRSLLLAFNNVLETWAELADKSKDFGAKKFAVQNAEHLLVEMGSNRRGALTPEQPLYSVVPDVVSFNTVITAWGKCGKQSRSCRKAKHAKKENHATVLAERAEALLDLLLELASAQNTSGTSVSRSLKPTASTYNAVIKAWVESGDAQAPERAISLLHDMVDRSESYLGHQGPTPRTFSHVFNALARSHLVDAHSPIQELLNFMESLNISPNTAVYNTILTAYFRSKPRTPLEAYKVCEHMNDILGRMKTSSLPTTQPDKISYQTIIQAWVDCGMYRGQGKDIARKCAKRAAAQLDAALEREIPVDIHTFHHVMSAFSSNPLDVEHFFSRIKMNPNMAPNRETYVILLDALKKATRPGEMSLSQRADEYLNEMEKESLRTDGKQRPEVCPDTNCYNNVIMSWSATRSRHGAKRADSVLDRFCKVYHAQLEQYRKEGLQIISRPNTTSFMHVIAAIAKHYGPAGIPRVERLVQQMDDMASARKCSSPQIAKKMSAVEPNIITYNLLLGLYAKYSSLKKKDLGWKAEQLVEYMESLDEMLPDKYSYTHLIVAYGKTRKPVSDVIDLLDRLETRKFSQGKELDMTFFKQVLKVLRHSSDEDNAAKRRIQKLLADLKSGMWTQARHS